MTLHSKIFLPAFLACVIAGTMMTDPIFAADELPQPFADTSRIVTIGGSLTEIIYALDKQDQLVGRDSTSTFPPEATNIPDIGYARQLAPEGVLSVAPTAILAIEGSGPPETLNVLTKATVPITFVPERFDRDGILGKIGIVGAAVGESERAEQLAQEVASIIDAAEKRTTGLIERKRVLFILSLQGGRVLASGQGTAANGIISMAGAVNVIQQFEGYKQISDEALMEAQPDVILMMNRGDGLDASTAELMANPAISATPAARNGAIVRMDGTYLLGFGPRSGAALNELISVLYGERVAD